MKKEQHNPELEKQNIADQDTQELENMLEQASKEAQEAEISPLIAKIAELEKALQEKEEIAKIAKLHICISRLILIFCKDKPIKRLKMPIVMQK